MTESVPTPQPPASVPARPRRRVVRGVVIITAVLTLAAGIGVAAVARGHGPGGWHHGGFTGAHLDPAKLDERLDRMLGHLYVEVDATDAQKQQIAPIVKAAARDLLPMRDRMRDARRRATTLLAQPTVDRGALEALRAGHLQLAEQASRRLTQALADVADVLTPEQRRQLAERAGRWHGRRG